MRCFEAGAASFTALVRQLTTGTLTPMRQDLSVRSYFGKYRRPDAAGVIVWDRQQQRSAPRWRRCRSARCVTHSVWPSSLRVIMRRSRSATPQCSDCIGRPPGTIVDCADHLVVASRTNDVLLDDMATIDGAPLSLAECISRFHLQVGGRLPLVTDDVRARLTAVTDRVCRAEDAWVEKLVNLDAIELPYARQLGPSQPEPQQTMQAGVLDAPCIQQLMTHVGDVERTDLITATVVTYLSRLAGRRRLTVGYSEGALGDEIGGLEGYFSSHVPLAVDLDADRCVDVLRATATRSVPVVAISRTRATSWRDIRASLVPGRRRRGSVSDRRRVGGERSRGEAPEVLASQSGSWTTA